MHECGGCTACCERLKVPELEKPASQRCLYQGPDGCLDYQNRPASCRNYECMWRNEDAARSLKLEDWARPDRLGVILSAVMMNGVPVLLMSELTDGAADGYWPQKLILRLRKRAPVVVVWPSRADRWYGPPHAVQRARDGR